MIGESKRDGAVENLFKKWGVKDLPDLLAFPKFIQIETVATCNARCVMCTVEDWERSTILMSDALFDKILAQLEPRARWIERVTPQLGGEPLIDKKIESRIAELKRIGIRHTEITCNASLLDAKRREGLLGSGLDRISFSIDGNTAETFEKIRKRLKFEECINNILEFVALRDKLGVPLSVRIRMTVQPDNEHEYEDYLAFWKKHLAPGDIVYGKLLHNFGGRLTAMAAPELDEEEKERLNNSACISPFTTLVIFSDGRVPMCCIDMNAEHSFGNINDASIEEIWHGSAVNWIRQQHLTEGRKGVEMCVDCNCWDEVAQL